MEYKKGKKRNNIINQIKRSKQWKRKETEYRKK